MTQIPPIKTEFDHDILMNKMQFNNCGMNLEKNGNTGSGLVGVTAVIECVDVTSCLQLNKGLIYRSKLLCKHT